MSTEIMWYLAELQTRTQHQELTLEQAKALLAGVERSALANWVAWHEGLPQWTKVTDLPEFALARPAPPPLPDFLPTDSAAAPVPEPTQLQQRTVLLAREKTVEMSQYQAQLQAQQQAAGILAQQEAAAQYAQQQAYLAQQQAAQLAQFQQQQANAHTSALLPGASEGIAGFPPAAAEPETDWAALRKHPRYAVRLKVVVVSQQRTFRSFTRDISLGGCLLENEVPWSVLGGICQVYISNPEGVEAIEFSGQVLSDPRNPCRLMFREQDARTQGKLDSWLASMTVAHRRVA